MNILLKNRARLWKTRLRRDPWHMAQNVALGNSFSALAELYLLGIGGVFG
ncbi:MAG: hypothetical protein Q7U56_10055 [Humidesulfovibrio sp.]|nr:hypothetical protein [Humidesulfovibrio sp.]